MLRFQQRLQSNINKIRSSGSIIASQRRYLQEHIVRSPDDDKLNLPSLANLSLPKFLLSNFLDEKKVNQVAIVDGFTGESLTFGQVYKNTTGFASALRKLGIGQDITRPDCVAIISPNTINYFAAFNGVALLGSRTTTVNPLYTETEMEHQIKVTGTRLIVAHVACMAKATAVGKKLGIPVISMGKSSPAPASATPNPNPTPSTSTSTPSIVAMEDLIESEIDNHIELDSFAACDAKFDAINTLITLPFSSGTTGNPKGVELTHRNLTSNILQTMPYEGSYLTPTSSSSSSSSPSSQKKQERGTTLVPLPFFHIYGMVCGMCMPLYAGGKLVIMPSFDMIKFLEIIQTYKVTRALVVPPVVLALAKHPIVSNYNLSSLECLLSGAAPLGAEVQKACSDRLKVLVKQGWGMTELSPVGTLTPGKVVSDAEKSVRAGSGGLLVPGTEAKIVDAETKKDLHWSEEGELLIRGPQVMKGYYNNPTATQDTIRNGWLHTGDVAKFDKDGYLFITDRCKELIKYKGFQVPPAELEAVIASHPAVKDVIVIPVPDDEAGELPRAYVVLQEKATVTEAELAKFVEGKVAPHKKLRGGVIFCDSVPKSASGKLLRRQQVQMDRERHKK